MLTLLGLMMVGFVGYELFKTHSGNDDEDIIVLDEHGRIVGSKNIVKAKRLMVEKEHVIYRWLCYYININTEEIWAEYYNSHTTYLDKSIINFDLNNYKMNMETVTADQLDMIKDMIIKKYKMYPYIARETTPKGEIEKYMTRYLNQ